MTDIDHAVVAIAAARVGAKVRVEWIATKLSNPPPPTHGLFWVVISDVWFELTCLQAVNLYSQMIASFYRPGKSLLAFTDSAYRHIRAHIALKQL